MGDEYEYTTTCPGCGSDHHVEPFDVTLVGKLDGKQLQEHGRPDYQCRECGCCWHDPTERYHERDNGALDDQLRREGFNLPLLVLPEFIHTGQTAQDYHYPDGRVLRERTHTWADGHVTYSYAYYRHGETRSAGMLDEPWSEASQRQLTGSFCRVDFSALPEPVPVADPSKPPPKPPSAAEAKLELVLAAWADWRSSGEPAYVLVAKLRQILDGEG